MLYLCHMHAYHILYALYKYTHAHLYTYIYIYIYICIGIYIYIYIHTCIYILYTCWRDRWHAHNMLTSFFYILTGFPLQLLPDVDIPRYRKISLVGSLVYRTGHEFLLRTECILLRSEQEGLRTERIYSRHPW